MARPKSFLIYTDGSFWRGDAAGCAYCFRYEDDGSLWGAYQPLGPLETPEQAELAGMKLALEHLLLQWESDPAIVSNTVIWIVCDNFDGVQKVNDVKGRGGWVYRGSRVQEVVDLVEEMERKSGVRVEVIWQRRNSTPQASQADAWAKEASGPSWTQDLKAQGWRRAVGRWGEEVVREDRGPTKVVSTSS